MHSAGARIGSGLLAAMLAAIQLAIGPGLDDSEFEFRTR